MEQDVQQKKMEADCLWKKLELLETSKSQLLGEELESCSFNELHGLEGKIEQSLQRIRKRKYHVLKEQISQLKEEVIFFFTNKALQCKLFPQLPASTSKGVPPGPSDQDTSAHGNYNEVETELRIGFAGREAMSSPYAKKV